MRALIALLALTGCASAVPAAGPGPDPAPTPTAVSTVSSEDGDFHLTVTNQSFIDATAEIRVTIDGVQALDAPFEVGGQHNFFGYSFRLEPGEHTLVATGPNETRLEKTFRLPEAGDRYGILTYWNYEDEGPRLDWQFQTDPPAFA